MEKRPGISLVQEDFKSLSYTTSQSVILALALCVCVCVGGVLQNRILKSFITRLLDSLLSYFQKFLGGS